MEGRTRENEGGKERGQMLIESTDFPFFHQKQGKQETTFVLSVLREHH